MERIGREIDAPLLANMVTAGRTPMLSAERLKELGFSIAIYPGLGMNAAAAAVRDAYTYLQNAGSAIGIDVPIFGFGADGRESIHELAGFPDVWEFEKKWGLGE
jgi:2-methylisocitrate lyase-like PEP mutase family enzyme